MIGALTTAEGGDRLIEGHHKRASLEMKSMSKGQERRKEAFLLVAFVQLNMNFSVLKNDATENDFVKYFINQGSI